MGIASINPFRYRGYYWDRETGLFYIGSRYYDPQIGRFINADDPEILILAAESDYVLGTNLFAYCYNNPAMRSDPMGYGVSPVGWPGYFYNNYKTSVSNWAAKYAPMSNNMEYGAIIYRFKVFFQTLYFIGETYKGFKTQNWYTVINGLGIGYLASIGARNIVNLFWPTTALTVIGFVHTHPVDSSNSPSGPDVWLKRLGWIISLKIFPIAVYSNKKVSINYF